MDSGRAPKEKHHSRSVSLVMDTFIQRFVMDGKWNGSETISRALAVVGRNVTSVLGS